MQWLREYFGFTRTEFRGAIVLFGILLSVVLSQLYYHEFASKAKYDFSDEQRLLDSINDLISIEKENISNSEETTRNRNERVGGEKSINEKVELKLSEFNPNEISEKELVDMGFPSSVSKGLLNYRKAGGKFFKKEDFKKLYTVDEAFFRKVEPYIVIPDVKRKEVRRAVVDINSADTTELKTLVGVGAYYAKRIVERRNELGGFVKKEQLLEIWKLDSSVLIKNECCISLGSAAIRKMTVNHAEADELAKHPYINKKQATVITKYRQQHGAYRTHQDLLKTKIVDSAWVNRVAPYLSFE